MAKGINGNVEIKDYGTAIEVLGTSNSNNITSEKGNISLIGSLYQDELDTKNNIINSANGILLTSNIKPMSGINKVKNTINLNANQKIEIKNYLTGINATFEDNSYNDEAKDIKNDIILSGNNIEISNVGTGILSSNVNIKLQNAEEININADESLKTNDPRNSLSGKAIMAQSNANVNISSEVANTISGTTAAIDNFQSTVEIKSRKNTLSYKESDNAKTQDRAVIFNNSGNTTVSGTNNIIFGGEHTAGYYYKGTVISAKNTVEKGTSRVDILAGDSNRLYGLVSATGDKTTVNIGGELSKETIIGSRENTITSGAVIKSGDKDYITAVSANDKSEINIVAGNQTGDFNFITTENRSDVQGKTILVTDGKVNIQGNQNRISSGGEFKFDSGTSNYTFIDHYKGTAIEVNGTTSSTATITANNDNQIAGAITISGTGSTLNIDNTALANGINNIISANVDNNTVTTVSVKEGAKVNITGTNATNIIRAFVDQDNAKLATAGITEKAVVVDNGTFTLTGANNIISAGATKATTTDGITFTDTYTGIALDVKSTATITASGQNSISGSVTASGTKHSIDIKNTASTGGINNITSANVDNNTVTAVSVKDSATVNITGTNTTNIIRAFVNQDNVKLATDGITEKAVVVDNGTFNVTGVDNIISAGSTKTTEGKDIKFIDTYKGVAIDSIKGQVNISGSNSNIISGAVKAEQNTTLRIGGRIEGSTFEGSGSNQIISAQKDGDSIKALEVSEATVRIKAGYGTDDKNYIKAAENPDGENSSTTQQKAVSVNIGSASLDGYQNWVFAGNKGEGIALEAIRPSGVPENSRYSSITLNANSNLVSGAVISKGTGNSITINVAPTITANAKEVGAGSNKIFSTAVVDDMVTAISAKDSSVIKIIAGLNNGNSNYIEASTVDDKQIKAILSESSTVYIKGYDNAIYAGKNAEGIAIDTTTGTNSQVKVEASKDNSLTGALISKGEANKIELIANGNQSVAGYSSDEVMNEGSNQIISSATVDIDSSKAIAAVVAQEKTNIKILAGTGSGQNYIKAENKNSGNGYEENAVVANTSNVDISSSANFIITGEDEKDGKGVALKATSSTINAAANVSNIVAGAVIADSSSNIDLGKKDLSAVTRDAAQLSRNTENHINSTYHYKESDKEYVLGVLAKGSSNVNMLGTTNTISATSDDSAEKRAVWADSSTVKIDGEKNQIVAGEKGEGLALNAISSTVNSTADKTNAIAGAVIATSTSNVDLAKNNATTVVTKEASNISRNESNQIISTYHYKDTDSKDYVLGVLARDTSNVNILGTTNTISATSDDSTEKRAVWADKSNVKIDGAKNQIVAGEKGEGLALNAINSTVNSTADTSNAIWGAVVANGTSNIDLAKNNATNVVAKEASNISRNESNQIISTYHYKDTDSKDYVLGVLARDTSNVNILGATNTISATSDDSTEKRAVWADTSNIIIDGKQNQIVAGTKGEGIAINAVNTSTVDATADESNILYGAVIADEGSTVNLGAKATDTMAAGKAENIQSNKLNSIASSYYIESKAAGNEHNIVSAVYAENNSEINLKAESNVITTDSNAEDKERAIWAESGTINIEGKTTIVTSNGSVEQPNSVGIALVAGVTKKTDTNTKADSTAKINATLDSDSYIYGDIIAGETGSIDLNTRDANTSNLYVQGNILAGNGGTLDLDFGKNAIFTGRIDSYMDAQDNKEHGSNFFTPEFSNQITSQGTISLKLGENSRWNVTGQSWVNNLEVGNNTVIDMTGAGTDKNVNSDALTITNFTGNATVNMHLDMNNKKESDMIYIKNGEGSLNINLDHAINQDEIGANGLRFATLGKGSKITVDSVKAVNRGAFNVEYEIEKDVYKENDKENAAYNGSSFDDKKPGQDAVNNFFKDDTKATTLEEGEEQPPTEDNINEETTNFKIKGVGEIQINDIGRTIINLSEANYNNAVFMDSMNNRRGEARYLEGNEGFWVRMGHAGIGKSAFDISNNVYQLGYDKLYGASKGERRIGVVADYMTGDTSYRDISASGKVSRKGLWLYNTWIGDDGHYTDLVAKWGHLESNFDLYVPDEKISGEYTNNVFSVSGEFGYKKDLGKDWYIEPQIQMQYAYITGADYTTSQNTNVKADDMNSFITRAGFRIGKEIENKTTVYLKADVVHEFLGNLGMHTVDDTGEINDTFRNSGTWYNVGFGVATMLQDNTYAYVSYERSLGNDNANTYQVNGGVRWAF